MCAELIEIWVICDIGHLKHEFDNSSASLRLLFRYWEFWIMDLDNHHCHDKVERAQWEAGGVLGKLQRKGDFGDVRLGKEIDNLQECAQLQHYQGLPHCPHTYQGGVQAPVQEAQGGHAPASAQLQPVLALAGRAGAGADPCKCPAGHLLLKTSNCFIPSMCHHKTAPSSATWVLVLLLIILANVLLSTTL